MTTFQIAECDWELILNRVWKYININKYTNCWEWTGCKHGRGKYGVIRYKHKNISAHKAFYEIYTHEIVPKNLLVCHHCDNPACVNPAHLYIGTHQDNMDDMVQRGRSFHGVGELHSQNKLTADNVKTIKKLLKSGKLSHKEIGRLFGVARQTIANISTGNRWRHIK